MSDQIQTPPATPTLGQATGSPYCLHGFSFASSEDRQMAAEQSPHWDQFVEWWNRRNWWKPNMDERHDRDSFESYVEGASRFEILLTAWKRVARRLVIFARAYGDHPRRNSDDQLLDAISELDKLDATNAELSHAPTRAERNDEEKR